jgi:hypothetical protein
MAETPSLLLGQLTNIRPGDIKQPTNTRTEDMVLRGRRSAEYVV